MLICMVKGEGLHIAIRCVRDLLDWHAARLRVINLLFEFLSEKFKSTTQKPSQTCGFIPRFLRVYFEFFDAEFLR